MNILITGAFGFVGANLSKALSANKKHRLTALDMSEPPAHNYNEFYTWPELDKLSGKPLDAIIHLAGKAHDTRNTAAEQEYFDINLGLTQKIFEFFLQSGAKKFIFFSSVKAAADTVQGDSLTETVEPSPGTPYGRSKLAAENYLLQQFSKPATSNQQPATSNQQPATSNQQPTTSNQQPAASNPVRLHRSLQTNLSDWQAGGQAGSTKGFRW
jgi:nucleoside-diphosphate-sugar epimerase